MLTFSLFLNGYHAYIVDVQILIFGFLNPSLKNAEEKQSIRHLIVKLFNSCSHAHLKEKTRMLLLLSIVINRVYGSFVGVCLRL